MKKFIKLSFFLLAICILIACGGGKKATPEKKSGDFPLEVEKTVSGPFSESLEVTNAVLKISERAFGSKLMVEVKRTSAELPLDPNDADVCGVSSGKSYKWCILADILGESNLPVETNMDKYGYESFEQLLSLNEGETVWLEFSTRDNDLANEPSKAKKVKLSSKVEHENRTISGNISSSKTTASGGSQDWDAILKSYENFIDQYIKLYKKAQSGDMSALAEYGVCLEKANALSEKLASAGGNLSSTQADKFLKLQAKLTKAISGM